MRIWWTSGLLSKSWNIPQNTLTESMSGNLSTWPDQNNSKGLQSLPDYSRSLHYATSVKVHLNSIFLTLNINSQSLTWKKCSFFLLKSQVYPRIISILSLLVGFRCAPCAGVALPFQLWKYRLKNWKMNMWKINSSSSKQEEKGLITNLKETLLYVRQLWIWSHHDWAF